MNKEIKALGNGDFAVQRDKKSEFPHKWDRDGERCVKCGGKDWMGGLCHISDDEYYGSEKHFRDLQDAARKTAYIEDPKTLEEFRQNFRLALRELGDATGFTRWMDSFLRAIGRFLIKMGWDDGKK